MTCHRTKPLFQMFDCDVDDRNADNLALTYKIINLDLSQRKIKKKKIKKKKKKTTTTI